MFDSPFSQHAKTVFAAQRETFGSSPAFLEGLRPFQASCNRASTCPGPWKLLVGWNSNDDPIVTLPVSVSDLRQCREGEPANLLVVCRDSAGEQMTRGGEHVMVSIIHKGKKNW